ncbi:hypothetical protein MMC24_000773 [Lignoscripta atroalba]|nr:hypothetical protein [Lignoscripta atroalba]
MVNYSKVAQGTGRLFTAVQPPVWVGSDGAVTCLEISILVQGQGVFVAHADCAEQVSGAGSSFDYVKTTFAQQLTTALGVHDPNVHTAVQSFSGGTDDALLALREDCGSGSGPSRHLRRGIGLG